MRNLYVGLSDQRSEERIAMPRITIDGQVVEVPSGSTILDAARRLGIHIPTMCYVEGGEPAASCMLCVVRISATGRLVPSCAALVEDGMVVENDCAEVRSARKAALELLLSDHAGDCVAPCKVACPAGIDIPAAIRSIINDGPELGPVQAANGPEAAASPVPCRTCRAPCEKACRRRLHDAPVSIRLLVMFAADRGLVPPVEQSAAKARKKAWSVHIGRPLDAEMEKFVANAGASARIAPSGGEDTGYAAEEARAEALRCFKCDCPKAEACLLRRYAAEYEVEPPRHSRNTERRLCVPDEAHQLIEYDSGKCISCGICVKISDKEGERLGLALLGRGFGVRVGTPFDEPLSATLKSVAEACAAACPTGALALRRNPQPELKD